LGRSPRMRAAGCSTSWTTCRVPSEVTGQVTSMLSPGSQEGGSATVTDRRRGVGGASSDRPGGWMGDTLPGAYRGKAAGIAGDVGVRCFVAGNVPLHRWERRRRPTSAW
jgi:hypothetical protein